MILVYWLIVIFYQVTFSFSLVIFFVFIVIEWYVLYFCSFHIDFGICFFFALLDLGFLRGRFINRFWRQFINRVINLDISFSLWAWWWFQFGSCLITIRIIYWGVYTFCKESLWILSFLLAFIVVEEIITITTIAIISNRSCCYYYS